VTGLGVYDVPAGLRVPLAGFLLRVLSFARATDSDSTAGLPFTSVATLLTTCTDATGPVSVRLAVFRAFWVTASRMDPLPSDDPVPLLDA
jgi:hypothetical protein